MATIMHLTTGRTAPGAFAERFTMSQLSDQEILIAAIEKAIAGGYNRFSEGFTAQSLVGRYLNTHTVAELIYNHDFAKAFWGESSWYFTENSIWSAHTNNQYLAELPAWQYHLQQMVIADDPIKYLGENT